MQHAWSGKRQWFLAADFFAVADVFLCQCGHTYMLTSSNVKMTFSVAIVSNFAITTLKFVNEVVPNKRV